MIAPLSGLQACIFMLQVLKRMIKIKRVKLQWATYCSVLGGKQVFFSVFNQFVLLPWACL